MIAAFILLVLLFALLVVDWLQTLGIALHPDRWYELNPILGEHPSPLAVHLWFAVCLWALAIVTIVLPVQFLRPLLFFGCIAEIICVVNNWRLGLRP